MSVPFGTPCLTRKGHYMCQKHEASYSADGSGGKKGGGVWELHTNFKHYFHVGGVQWHDISAWMASKV